MDSEINQDWYVEINAQLSMVACGTALTVYRPNYYYRHVFLVWIIEVLDVGVNVYINDQFRFGLVC